MKGFKVIFGRGEPGVLGAPVVGFEGPGEPGQRYRLTWDERRVKRKLAKQRRNRRRRPCP